jgi:hypothetical protein
LLALSVNLKLFFHKICCNIDKNWKQVIFVFEMSELFDTVAIKKRFSKNYIKNITNTHSYFSLSLIQIQPNIKTFFG